MFDWILAIYSTLTAVRRIEVKMDELLAKITMIEGGVTALQEDLGQVTTLVKDLRDQLASGGTDVSGAVARLDAIGQALTAMDTAFDAITAPPAPPTPAP